MPDMLADGNIKVTYVPTIPDISAPVVSELSSGTDLECLITGNGFAPTVDEEVVSVPKLCETINAQGPGRATHSIQLTMVRKTDTAEDIAWTTMLRNTKGFLVVRYGVPYDTDYAEGDELQVFPGACGERRPQTPEANSAVTFMSQWYVSAQPDLDAVVASAA